MEEKIFRNPDLSNRLLELVVKKNMKSTPSTLFKAWTQEFETWFAAPGTVIMEGQVNTTFFFETEYKFEASQKAQREPHYGRFLRIKENELVELTWITGPNGTKGAETVVKVTFEPLNRGTDLTLTHSGFLDEESKNQHKEAWPEVLKQMDEKYDSR
ncbi:SRPBCC domain-containing protein [Allomuricauda sp. d1]|uniref:SRPBCC family protein n=1 Tax=Allomuricauda sp. d1 TaxID=3136725 RepID=UPI0031E4138B